MSPIWLLFLLINLGEAAHMAYAMFRAKKRLIWRAQRQEPPTSTVARFIVQPESAIIATQEGRLITTNNESQSEPVSELFVAFEIGDLETFTLSLKSRVFISESEAFLLYRHILLTDAWFFEAALLQVCKPVLLSPILASFVLRNVHFLEHVNSVFLDAESFLWERLLLQELILHRDIPEADLRIILQFVNVNLPLLNGYPLIFHLIYYNTLPSYYLTTLLSVERLDLHPQPVIGSIPAEWSNLPLLLHALVYNHEAFYLLQSKIAFQDILPSFDQLISIFL